METPQVLILAQHNDRHPNKKTCPLLKVHLVSHFTLDIVINMSDDYT